MNIGLVGSIIALVIVVGIFSQWQPITKGTMIVDSGSDIASGELNFGNAEMIEWETTIRQNFVFNSLPNGAYQLNDELTICVGDCLHPVSQQNFMLWCSNNYGNNAYFSIDGEGLRCDTIKDNTETLCERYNEDDVTGVRCS